MPFLILCPNCGRRPHTEFVWGGEALSGEWNPEDEDADFARSWLRENTYGPQRERWFHSGGCRRWLTLVRDTRNNEIVDGIDRV